MSVTHTIGDLIQSDEEFIAHGCNTKGAMGAGIARVIARQYPEVERVYSAHCRTRDFVVGSCLPVRVDDRTVFNLGTQEFPGADASYWGIMLSFGNLFEHCRAHGIERVAIPRIGCGIGGLDWNAVEWVITGVYDWCPRGPEIVVYTHPNDVATFGVAA
jgi:O-acetyl-ADP-ribose deacetylase (regulator of RNase III)